MSGPEVQVVAEPRDAQPKFPQTWACARVTALKAGMMKIIAS